MDERKRRQIDEEPKRQGRMDECKLSWIDGEWMGRWVSQWSDGWTDRWRERETKK